MLHPFVSSRSTPLRGVRGLVASLVLHGALITAFAAASGGTRRHVQESFGSVHEHVAFTRLVAPRMPSARAAAERDEPDHDVTAQTRARRVSAFTQLAKLMSSLPKVELPDLTRMGSVVDVATHFESLVSAGDEFASAEADAVSRLIGRAYARPRAGGVYSEEVVERTILPRRGNPIPRYPPSLLHQRIEANLLVTFVVDSTGRVDRKSIAFKTGAHELFVAAVRRALDRARYHPAEIGGRPVSQLAQQYFKFAVVR
jgi:TonB family protein